VSGTLPLFLSPEARESVRRLLAEVGYSEEGVSSLLRAASVGDALRAGRLVLARRTVGGSALETMVRLFLGSLDVPEAETRAALGANALAALDESHLIERVGEAVRATVRLTPFRGFVIASDRAERHRSRAFDFVLAPGAVTGILADLTIRRPVGSALDLGCGSGALGLLAAAHARRVAALDVSARAVAFSRFNAELNGVDGVECAEGDLFGPVERQRFDLVVCNPPFALSPAATFLYRDGGDRICERIAREAPAHLSDGGTLQMLCNWPERKGESWETSLARWFGGSGCDAWVLRASSLDSETYALAWLSQEFEDREVPSEALAEWAGFFERLHIDTVGAGLVVMRRVRGREPWVEFREMPRVSGAAGESIARTLAARDLAARSPDGEILAARLRPAPGLERSARERATQEGWRRMPVELKLSDGLAFGASVDPVMDAVVMCLDGARSVGEALALAAEHFGTTPEPFREDLPRGVKRLLELGLLVPVDAP
jgi:methylase of polypeptide subunit release factors